MNDREAQEFFDREVAAMTADRMEEIQNQQTTAEEIRLRLEEAEIQQRLLETKRRLEEIQETMTIEEQMREIHNVDVRDEMDRMVLNDLIQRARQESDEPELKTEEQRYHHRLGI